MRSRCRHAAPRGGMARRFSARRRSMRGEPLTGSCGCVSHQVDRSAARGPRALAEATRASLERAFRLTVRSTATFASRRRSVATRGVATSRACGAARGLKPHCRTEVRRRNRKLLPVPQMAESPPWLRPIRRADGSRARARRAEAHRDRSLDSLATLLPVRRPGHAAGRSQPRSRVAARPRGSSRRRSGNVRSGRRLVVCRCNAGGPKPTVAAPEDSEDGCRRFAAPTASSAEADNAARAAPRPLGSSRRP